MESMYYHLRLLNICRVIQELPGAHHDHAFFLRACLKTLRVERTHVVSHGRVPFPVFSRSSNKFGLQKRGKLGLPTQDYTS